MCTSQILPEQAMGMPVYCFFVSILTSAHSESGKGIPRALTCMVRLVRCLSPTGHGSVCCTLKILSTYKCCVMTDKLTGYSKTKICSIPTSCRRRAKMPFIRHDLVIQIKVTMHICSHRLVLICPHRLVLIPKQLSPISLP